MVVVGGRELLATGKHGKGEGHERRNEEKRKREEWEKGARTRNY